VLHVIVIWYGICSLRGCWLNQERQLSQSYCNCKDRAGMCTLFCCTLVLSVVYLKEQGANDMRRSASVYDIDCRSHFRLTRPLYTAASFPTSVCIRLSGRELQPCSLCWISADVSDALFEHLSARCTTDCACCHQWPRLPDSCRVCLEQFAGDRSCIGIRLHFFLNRQLYKDIY